MAPASRLPYSRSHDHDGVAGSAGWAGSATGAGLVAACWASGSDWVSD